MQARLPVSMIILAVSSVCNSAMVGSELTTVAALFDRLTASLPAFSCITKLFALCLHAVAGGFGVLWLWSCDWAPIICYDTAATSYGAAAAAPTIPWLGSSTSDKLRNESALTADK